VLQRACRAVGLCAAALRNVRPTVFTPSTLATQALRRGLAMARDLPYIASGKKL
jgi:hypothetical protein